MPTSLSRGAPLGLVVFVVGASSLGTEIAAARLMAPWFGDSTIIWANTIATVLLALSAGYFVGGRLADRDPSARGLSRVVLVSAVLFGVVPFVADPFLSASVEALETVSAGAFIGSLIAVLVLVAVPVLLLGTVAPYAIRLAVTTVEEAGSVSGRLYAISTLGSLAGTFGAALVLIPFAGTRRTFLVFGLLLALVAAAGLARRFLVVPLVLAGLIALPVGTIKASRSGTVIWERNTEYQYARVVEDPGGERRLELNEGEAIHSIYRPGAWLTGNYWDELLVLPFAARKAPPRSVAILGNAAGTTARSLGHFFPRTRIDGVEIDGELSEVGRELFDLHGPNLHLHTEDARPFLRKTDRRYDAIVVDAYHQPYVPFYLATREFFELVRDHLTPGGSVMVNVGHPSSSDTLEQVLTKTMRSVFGTVLRDPSQPVNTVLLATAGDASPARLRAAAPTLPRELRDLALGVAARLGPALSGGEVYTDDRAPVEWLVDASIVQAAAKGERP